MQPPKVLIPSRERRPTWSTWPRGVSRQISEGSGMLTMHAPRRASSAAWFRSPTSAADSVLRMSAYRAVCPPHSLSVQAPFETTRVRDNKEKMKGAAITPVCGRKDPEVLESRSLARACRLDLTSSLLLMHACRNTRVTRQ